MNAAQMHLDSVHGELDLWDKKIGKAGFACLIAALAANTTVDAFRLSDTGISGADAVALIEALQARGRTVRYINLGANELSKVLWSHY